MLVDRSAGFAPGERARDASGILVAVPRVVRRIVSLVPSVTETLFVLGLGERVVGITDWCIHPADALAGVARVRGTKNPDCAAIAGLAPDLVLANVEENREVDVRRLRERGLTVWVDYPRTVAEALAQVHALARLGAAADALRAVVEPISAALARATDRARGGLPARCFIAVWKDPWMTVGRDTYAHDLLALAGLWSVYGDADGRYPRVTLTDVAGRDPDVVLLPDEPYRFTATDARELSSGPLAATSAARCGRIVVVDGTLPFWPGPRTALALDTLGALASP